LRTDVALVEVAKTTSVPEGEARKFVVNGVEVAVANLGAGVFRALGDVCSHAHYYLSEGEVDVEDRTIECPKHGSVFDLDTGVPRSLPATTAVPAYRTQIEGDAIMIEMGE
jgi:3-phenylpropionate/trans-cinnamate dioxygenase ferredoxin subunit